MGSIRRLTQGPSRIDLEVDLGDESEVSSKMESGIDSIFRIDSEVGFEINSKVDSDVYLKVESEVDFEVDAEDALEVASETNRNRFGGRFTTIQRSIWSLIWKSIQNRFGS